MKRMTIHYIAQEDGTYTEEQRVDDVPVHIRTKLSRDVADPVLDTTAAIYGAQGTLRKMLEHDSEYAEWLSQMGRDPEDTDPAIVAIRRIIPYRPI